jgi:hypothetical protein
MKKLLLLFIPVIFLSCSKHDNFPMAIDVASPQVPANFIVEMPDIGIYELDWEVADSTQVSYYRIYIFDPFSGPAAFDETAVSEYYYEFPIAVTEVVWGVSSVSIENVESKIVYAFAPIQ